VWIGYIACFGMATQTGIVMLVYLHEAINARGGLFNLEKGILVDRVTSNESEMSVHACQAGQNIEAARISLSDAVVSFLASSADSRAFEKPLSITTMGLRPCAWRVEKDAGWLSVSPASGSGNVVVSVRVRAAGLEPGRYNGNLTVHCPEAVNSPQRVRVSLTVIEPRREGPPARSRPKSAS